MDEIGRQAPAANVAGDWGSLRPHACITQPLLAMATVHLADRATAQPVKRFMVAYGN